MAQAVFEDERCLIEPDHADATGEQRWHAIGAVSIEPRQTVLLAVHVYRENIYGEEIIRIISARKVEKDEFRRYQEQAVD